MRVWAVVNVNVRAEPRLGEAVDVFLDRQDAERFVEEVRVDEPELADELRIVERELNVRPGTN